ncbi:galactokinase [Tropicimonas marinistellae]|uniref:galactokinase n=1 Tax=Tropicimonas marinistellae TaxID=1739787 RepID=UPI00082BE49B|nr:galactokinase [Tropicimonas marinistellae]
MSDEALSTRVADAYEAYFGTAPEVATSAPGRVNLLGEHTDYNGGAVLPMALRGLGVGIAIGRGPEPGVLTAYSDTFHDAETRRIDESAAGRWSDYVLGSLKSVAEADVAETGARIALITTLPMGAGLSSSAALEVACLRAASTLFQRPMSAVDIAVRARAVENGFVGMPCGIMDQFAVSVGKPGEALFLDTRTLEHAPAPALPGHRFVVVHSGVSHQLTEDGYATRVAECAAACDALGVEMLSDLGTDDLDRLTGLSPVLERRARHVITDNQRARDGLAALKNGDAPAFAQLMIDSHASERDDFEITVPETDALAAMALEFGALGARQTGGGWGGAVVALVPDANVATFGEAVTARFPDARVLAIT